MNAKLSTLAPRIHISSVIKGILVSAKRFILETAVSRVKVSAKRLKVMTAAEIAHIRKRRKIA